MDDGLDDCTEKQLAEFNAKQGSRAWYNTSYSSHSTSYSL
jgi:hypothetical protein